MSAESEYFCRKKNGSTIGSTTEAVADPGLQELNFCSTLELENLLIQLIHVKFHVDSTSKTHLLAMLLTFLTDHDTTKTLKSPGTPPLGYSTFKAPLGSTARWRHGDGMDLHDVAGGARHLLAWKPLQDQIQAGFLD